MSNQDQNNRPLLTRIVGFGLCAFFIFALLASNAIPTQDGADDSPTASSIFSDKNSDSDDQGNADDSTTARNTNPLTGRAAPDTSRDNDRDADAPRQQQSDDEADNNGDSGSNSGNSSDDSGTESDANNAPKSASNAEDDSGTQQAASRTAGRPMFQLPFACGEDWELTTYAGHSPDDSKVDFFSDGGTTEGAEVVASAGGTVMKLPDPGGVKIDHGGGWYTLYIHMEDIPVSVGQDVKQGELIGHVGAEGTGVAHLHYEQLYNPDGGEAYTDENITLPKFGDEKIKLVPGTDYPTRTSQNSCG